MKKPISKYCLWISLFLLLPILFAGCASSQRFSSEGRACAVTSSSGSSKTSSERAAQRNTNISRIPRNESLNSIQRKIISNAETWLGVPYLWGGNTRRGVDCSGFVKNIYDDVGVSLPRTAQLQYNFSKKISERDKKVGDLVFFSKGSRITHVGIYIGGDQIIHSSSGRGVIKQSLSDSYLQRIYVGAGRVLE